MVNVEVLLVAQIVSHLRPRPAGGEKVVLEGR